MELLKVFIVQVLFAALPTLLLPPFESFFRKRASRRLTRTDHDSVALAFTFACSVSLLLCWLLDVGSTRIDGHLSLLPTAVGILYGIRQGAFPLAVLYVLTGYLFSGGQEGNYIWIEGLALFALVAVRSPMLRMKSALRRMLLIFWVMAAYIPHMTSHTHEQMLEGSVTADFVPHMLVELLAALSAGMLLFYSRRDAEKRYQLSEQASAMKEMIVEGEIKLKAFMRTLPGFALTLDRWGRITAVNDRAFDSLSEKMPSITREFIVGKDFTSLMNHVGMSADPGFLQGLDESIQGNRTVERMLSLNNRKFHFYVLPIRSESGEATGAVCSIYEVTEVERMRSELENMNRLSIIGQMAASVTHEVRNPMAVVRGYLQILQRKTPPEYEHYYKIVLEELDRAGGIIDDFLSLARTSSATKEYRSLRSVVEELWPLLQADANLRGQTIRLEDGKDGEKMLMNAGEIKQLVLNLARNALEAMEEKGELRIIVEQTEDSLRLRVKDNGPGIPRETLEQIRQPFFTTKKTGTGLGLVLCAGIAERHGGKLSIDSTVGEGTEVLIDFSYKEKPEMAEKA